MSECENLIALVRQRLTAATEDVCGLLLAKMSEYERELHRQGQLLDALTKSDVRVHKADVQLLLARESVEKGSRSPDRVDTPKVPLKCESPGLQRSPAGEDSVVDVDPPKLLLFKHDDEALGIGDTSDVQQLLARESVEKGSRSPDRVDTPKVPLKCESPGLQRSPAGEDSDVDVDPPKLLLFKHEDMAPGIRQKTEQREHHEGDITASTVSPVKEKPECSEPQPGPTEENADGAEDGAGGETDGDSHSDSQLEDDTEDSSDFSTQETDDSDDGTKSSGSQKPLSRPECSKRFSQSANLKTQMKIHTGPKPFRCSVCSRRFAQRVQLRHHMKHHSKEKRYSCNVCNQRFTLCHQLNTHKCAGRQSSQPRPSQTEGNRYMEPVEMSSEVEDGGGSDSGQDLIVVSQSPCNQSGSNPPQNNGLPSSSASSAQSRSGEKKFCCLVCGRRFHQEINLKFHMRVHLDGEWFVCSVCFQTFQCREHLTMHKKKHAEGTSFS